MSKRVCQIGCIAILAGFMVIGGGCSKQKVTAKSARRDLSPELQSMSLMSEQRKNMHARTHDTNMRQIWDDLDAILLLKHPVRLANYPMP